MSKLADMHAALQCRQPAGAVPLWELEFHLWDQFSGRHMVLGVEMQELSPAEQNRALRENAEIITAVSAELQFAAVTLPGPFWEQAPGQLAYYVLPDGAREEQARILRETGPDDLMLVATAGAIISPPGGRGYEQFMYMLFDAPEEIEAFAQGALRSGVEQAKRLQDLGMDAIVCPADIADNHGPFCRREQMERFVFPYLREWAAALREMGLYAILHTDGMIEPILEDLASSGPHAIQALDPIAGVDIRRVKRAIGDRLCLCGNVDCGLLHNGPAGRVYEETRELLRDVKVGGGFVLGASNAVFREAPPEHYRAMVDAWRDHGAY